MSHRTNTSTRFGFVRRYPFDLAAVSVAALLAYVIVTTFGSDSTLRLFATFPLALFLPGYATVSILFPAGKRNARRTASTAAVARPRGIDLVERAGLSFVLSLAITPVSLLVLPLTEWGLTSTSVAAGLCIGTVVIAQIAVVRRLRTPEGERFSGSLTAVVDRLRRDESGGSTVSSILLVLAIGMAISSLFVGFLMPVSAGGFTELALYSEDEDGEMVAGRLPSEVESGESIPFILSIENQEGEPQDYTVVVQQQVVEDGEVVERTELNRIDASVSDGATETGERSVTPTVAPNQTVRISMLLYHGEPPDEPTNENADQETHFWVRVTGG
ncbi:DUF1616 domain-containing protein [Natrinema gelatinilyticum]|uniref:DUF1616 domain-containing protein n=1 Tax=Natrinema gelatinilyticum TaxID=2961571 RepID=UPI0020C55E4A|nr:DUF1616 domain-containing protein [Natrinema gelatinilyticum]